MVDDLSWDQQILQLQASLSHMQLFVAYTAAEGNLLSRQGRHAKGSTTDLWKVSRGADIVSLA